MQRFTIPAVLLALGAALIIAAATLPRSAQPSFHGTALGPDAPRADFALEAPDRGTVSLSEFRGRGVLVFFGYTSCPDFCPMTMAKLRRVMDLLGDGRSDVEVLFISVDPELDSPRETTAYAQAFDPGFIGLTGGAAAIREAASAFGVYVGDPETVAAVPGPEHDGHEAGAHGAHDGDVTPPARLVAHSTHVFGLDRDGVRRVIWSADVSAEEIAADVRSLLRL